MGIPISIRLAGTGERNALEALQLRASLNNPGDRDAILAHPDAIVLPLEQLDAGQVFIAEQNGKVAGFAVVLPREDGQIELDGLFVDPSLWKGGIGRTLVDHCVAHARNFGAQTLHVTGNPHALGFYTACGFEHEGFTETRFGPGLSMRLQVHGSGSPT
jgi:GNAT superfamily N-acetyltransferase